MYICHMCHNLGHKKTQSTGAVDFFANVMFLGIFKNSLENTGVGFWCWQICSPAFS